jgi:hypothetical protein
VKSEKRRVREVDFSGLAEYNFFSICLQPGEDMSLVDDLRRLTLESQEKIKRERLAQETAEERQEAVNLISELPKVLKMAAEKGLNSQHAMYLDSQKHIVLNDGRVGPDPVTPERLRGAAKLVFEYCQKEGLNPQVDEHGDWIEVSW